MFITYKNENLNPSEHRSNERPRGDLGQLFAAEKLAVPDDYEPKIVFGATHGKKGHKAPRINMALSPENHAWIKERSKQLGISATELVNAIIENERLK